MLIDPHEVHKRSELFLKNESEEQFFSALNSVLADAILPLQKNECQDAATLPIIYIVGTPRSGTTLLSQLLSRHLPIGYIDNLIARFWERPSVGIRLSQALVGCLGRDGVAFSSKHGTTDGMVGPHEFGYFWRKWLALDSAKSHKLNDIEISAIDVHRLRMILEGEILATFNSPVVFKNVICGFQAGILSRAHPASLFVWIKRDPEEVVRSILNCRMDRYGSYDAWWSLKPSTYSDLININSPVLQVFGQVNDCAKEFEQELCRPGINLVSVNYSSLLDSPESVLLDIANRISQLGFDITPLPKEPPVFQRQSKIKLPDYLETECARVFANSR